MPGSSTLTDVKGISTARRGRFTRSVGFGLMSLFVLASFTGIYGPKHKTLTTADGVTTLSLHYGSIVRSGQVAPLEITVTRSGGFDGPVVLVFDRAVFERFDFQNWYPNPAAEVGEGEQLGYEFDPPDGDTFKVVLDARVAPTQLGGRHEHWLYVDVDGRPTARTDYVIWVMP